MVTRKEYATALRGKKIHCVIIYIDAHRENVHGAPHDVVHVNSSTLLVEVFFRWDHSDV